VIVSRELGRVQRQKESQPFKFSFSKKKKEDSLSVKYVGDFPFNFEKKKEGMKGKCGFFFT